MKRRLLSAFLAVMMVLTMAPVAFAADTSVDSYDSLVEAINSASDGDTIMLNGDIDVQQTLVVTKELTLNLAGHKLYNTNDLWDAPTKKDNNWSLISVRENGDLTITGNGTLNAKKDDCYAVDVQDETAKATLENGTFVGNITTVYVFEGTLVVKDGSYSIKQLNSNGVQNQYGLTINCYDQNYKNGTAKVLITGGTFAHFNPVDNAAEGTGTNFATSGYETVGGTDGLYTAQVKSDNAAAIDDVQYATLADAVAAANNGDTVTLLTTTAEDITIAQDKNITLDLNGKKLTNKTGHTITVEQGATLTINGVGTVDNVTHAKSALVNYGEVVLNNGVTLERSSEKGTLSPYSDGGNSCYTILNDKGATMTIKDATVKNNGGFSSAIRNGGDENCNDASNLTIDDGNFSGGINSVKNDECGILTINGGTFSNTSQYIIMNWNKATINNGTFSVKDSADAVLFTAAYRENRAVGELIVHNGTFTGNGSQKMVENHYGSSYTGTAVINDGVFSADPSDFCAEGKTGIKHDDGLWYVEAEGENAAEVDSTIVPATTTSNKGEAQKAAQEIEGAYSDSIEAAAKTVANNNTITDEEAATALKKVVNDAAAGNVKVIYQPYIDVKVTDAEGTTDDNDNTTFTQLSVDLTPMYRVIAAKSDVDDYEIDTNAVQIGEATKLENLNGTYEVAMQLPNGFVVPTDNKLSVKHEKANGSVEYYTGTVSKNGQDTTLTFTTNGFSPFTIYANVAAYIDGTAYPTLQAAVENVKNNETIKLAQDVDEATVVTVAKPINFKVNTDSKKFYAKKNIVAGSNTTVKVTGESSPYTYEFTYTKPSSGGSSGGSSSGKTTYKVTTSAVNNGGVNASPSSAEKGATITITLSPDKGYKLDKLTVTDGSGKTVSTVKKSDTVYTFTMPASAVKVGVSYVKATETPSETKFNDVSANDWFASAVDYVTGKGMMNGTADNTFSPKANTTRGMVVTVLYRLENQPSTSAASFTDVASGAYYANAVAWANANGIVSGYGSGKFGPNDKVTREQLAAILYRYAQYKKYDVSVGEDTNILSYDDAQSISSYAIPAIQWACGAGVVTGKSGSKLDPKGNATRAEVAAMLMRFCENVK